jgi:hypothetical protein
VFPFTAASSDGAAKKVRRSSGSFGVVKDDADRMALTGTQPADAVTHVDAIHTARPWHRPMMHWKDHTVSLAEWHHLGA